MILQWRTSRYAFKHIGTFSSVILVNSAPACTVGDTGCLGTNSQCVLVQGAATCTCDAGFVRIDAGTTGEICIPREFGDISFLLKLSELYL